MEQKKALSIYVVSFDWRDLFMTDTPLMMDKMRRDRLAPEINSFFSLAWSSRSYYARLNDRLHSRHIKARFKHARPLYDFLSCFLVPWYALKYNIRPDIFMVHDMGSLAAGWYFKLRYGTQLVLYMTNLPMTLVRTRQHAGIRLLYQRILEFLLPHMVDHVCVINHTGKEYVQKLGVSTDRIHILYPDVLARDAAYRAQAKSALVRKRYGLEGKKIMLSIGRLEKEKGFDRLISLFAGMSKDWVLIIAGEGREREALEDLAKICGVSDRVLFIGSINRKEIWNVYADADIFVLLSRSEGLGLVFWEAMAMGTPVLGTRVGGIVETIGSGQERGWFVPEDVSPGQFSKLVEEIISTPEKESRVKDARAYVETIAQDATTINDVLL